MRYKNAVVVLIVCALIVLCFRGCLEDEHIRERTGEFVEVHGKELLELYAMYEAVELSGSSDYSKIRAFEKRTLMKTRHCISDTTNTMI